MAKVAFIGLGNMGRGITKNIAQAGHTLMVWDIARVHLIAIVRVIRTAMKASTAE